MKDDTGKVIFDADEQKEVDRIIQERVARVKSEKPEDYDDLKQIVETLEEFEAYTGLSASEKKALLKQAAAETKQQKELEKLQQTAEEDGITPALAKKMKELEEKLEKSTKVIEEITSEKQKLTAEQQAKAKADAEWNEQVSEMNETHPDVDLDELAKNPKFMKFIKGKGMPLKELYEDFVEFIGETEAETIIKMKSKDSRSTSSGKGSSSDGGSYGLTESQKNLVKLWNSKNPNSQTTYKEYADLNKHTN